MQLYMLHPRGMNSLADWTSCLAAVRHGHKSMLPTMSSRWAAACMDRGDVLLVRTQHIDSMDEMPSLEALGPSFRSDPWMAHTRMCRDIRFRVRVRVTGSGPSANSSCLTTGILATWPRRVSRTALRMCISWGTTAAAHI
eukprot:365803-Chlamydomonas_euryale.AAC.18